MLIRGSIVLFLLLAAAMFAWFNPAPKPPYPQQARLIKIDADGNTIKAWAGPWNCVFDAENKLLWEVKSYREDIHDHQCSFSWYNNSQGAAKRGDCFIDGEASDTDDLINASNAAAYCGVTQWRLPTESELKTLIDTHPQPGGPLISREFFPYAKNAPYWTSDSQKNLAGHFQHLGEGALALDFGTGESQPMPYKNAAYVRLVADMEKTR